MPLMCRLRTSLCLMGLATLVSACGSSYQGPVTPHFDGQRFRNPAHEKSSSVTGYLWLRLTGAQAEWPEAVPPPVDAPSLPPERVNGSTVRVTSVGHATLLIQVAGLNVLTDPVWSERASPVAFAGPKRVASPSLTLAQLPPIDLVLISHDHYDHLDVPTLQALDARDRPRVIVPLGNLALVKSAMPASEVSEHDWGDKVALSGTAVVHVEPMLHGSGRGPFDQMATLWAAFVIQAGGAKVYFVGDSGYGDGRVFRAAGEKFDGFDLVILPIGAYEPTQFMADSHMTPAQAVKAMQDARGQRALAHHFGVFQLGFEAYDAPLNALAAALAGQPTLAERFSVLQPGEALQFTTP